MTNELDDLVLAYLSDTLDPAARLDFERRMAADPELSARIRLEQDLIDTLGDTPENRLRANLRRISDQFQTPESLGIALTSAAEKNRKSWWWMLTGVLLLGGGIVCWMLLRREASIPPLPSAIPTQETPAPVPKDVPTETAPAMQEPKQDRPKHATRPVAAALQPIPALESYIGSHTRGASYRLRLESPRSNETLARRAGKTDFRLSGKVEGRVPLGQTHQILLLSNNIRDFETMRPVERHPIALASDQTFIFEKQLTLPAGLYYILIEEEQTGEWKLVDKFMVK